MKKKFLFGAVFAMLLSFTTINNKNSNNTNTSIFAKTTAEAFAYERCTGTTYPGGGTGLYQQFTFPAEGPFPAQSVWLGLEHTTTLKAGIYEFDELVVNTMSHIGGNVYTTTVTGPIHGTFKFTFKFNVNPTGYDTIAWYDICKIN